MVVSSSVLALGGEIQFPGKSEPAPTPTPTALTTAATSDGSHSQHRIKKLRLYGRTPPHYSWRDPAHNLLNHSGLQLFALDGAGAVALQVAICAG